jgi:preprotein translocase subunit YajC
VFAWKTATTVTINGTNFNAGVTVSTTGGTVGTVTRVSSEQITVVLTYNTKGTFPLTVTNTDGGTATTYVTTN